MRNTNNNIAGANVLGNNYFLVSTITYLLLPLTLFLLTNCVETSSGGDINGPGTVTPTNNEVTLEIFYPVSGDSIRMGANLVQLIASDRDNGPGLGGANLFVDGTFIQTFIAVDGVLPNIIIHTDSLEKKLGWDPASIPNEIVYAIGVYNLDNPPKEATSGDIDSVYIDRRPEAPQNLGITRITNKSFNLYWDDESSNETEFEIWRKDGANAGFLKIRDLPANTISINDFVSSEFITYFYQVRALNGFGASEFSNIVNSAGVEGGGQPTNLVAEALGATRVKLTWTDNSNDELGFIIERTDPQTGEFEEISRVVNNSTEFIDINVLPATPYSYRVASYTSTSISAWSNIASVITFTEDVSPPLNLEATYLFDENAVFIEWIDNTTQEIGTIIERKDGLAGDFEIIGSTLVDVNNFTDSNLVANTLYTYRARHSTVSGFRTDYSNEDTVFVPILPPDAPSNLRISEFVPNQVYGLLWDDNSDDEDGFEIERVESITGNVLRIVVGENVKAYNDTLVDQTKSYTYKIRSFAGNRFSSYSNEVSTSSGTGSLSAPISFQAFQVIGTTNVQLIWDYSGANPLGFVIERQSAAETEFVEIDRVAPSARFYLDGGGLTVGLSYRYRIKAYDATDESDYVELNPPIVIQNP